MRLMRNTILLLMALMILLPSIALDKASAASIPSKNIYKAQTHFLKLNKFEKGQDIQTLSYDINNDGKDEIVLGAWNNQTEDSKSAIAIYDREGTLLSNLPLKNTIWLSSIHRFKNKTYKKVLAAEYVGGMSRSSNVEVFVWKKGKLHSVLQTDDLGHNVVYKDTDKDGNDEIIGTQVYSAAETDQMGWNWIPLDKSVYAWNAKKGNYVHYTYGQDGKRDDLRKPVRTIDKNAAVTLVNKAYNTVLANERSSAESFKKKMQFLFTYNLLESIVDGKDEIWSDEVALMKFDLSKSSFALSADKKSADLSQIYPIKNYADTGKTKNVKLTAGFLVTKYGWKINSLTVE